MFQPAVGGGELGGAQRGDRPRSWRRTCRPVTSQRRALGRGSASARAAASAGDARSPAATCRVVPRGSPSIAVRSAGARRFSEALHVLPLLAPVWQQTRAEPRQRPRRLGFQTTSTSPFRRSAQASCRGPAGRREHLEASRLQVPATGLVPPAPLTAVGRSVWKGSLRGLISRYARSRPPSPCPPSGRRASSSSATRAPRSAARARASHRSTGMP